MKNRVFLVGYMGSGKTTIGRYLAHDLGWSFIDMDDYFEQKHQCTIKEYFAQYGEDAFRDAEHAVVEELCSISNAVVATGGGAPCFFDNMDKMVAAGATIYISVEPEILAARLSKAKDKRPLIAEKTDEELLAYIKEKLAEREPFYRKAKLIVDGERLPFSMYKLLVESMPFDE
ncbi:MAG: shikimate kinase [Bacteroidales bacterium]|nr:shikimate kinase [Bacteroidales bacterium]